VRLECEEQEKEKWCRHREEDNIKRGLKELGYEFVAWFHLIQERGKWRAAVNAVTKLPSFLRHKSVRDRLRQYGNKHFRQDCTSWR